MNSSNLERAAYLAAHRIMQADLTNPQFACPGTRRSKMIDAIAGIIKDVMEAEEPPSLSWIEECAPFTRNDWDGILERAGLSI